MSEPKKPLSLARRLAFSAVALVLFLVLLEVSLAVLTPLLRPRRGPSAEDATGSSTVIYVVGDSVSYGTGVVASASWPMQLYQQLADRGATGITVINGAREGGGVGMLTDAANEIATLPAIQNLIVITMLGHNSFIYWTGLHTQLRQQNLTDPNAGSSSNDFTQRLRLLRIFRWIGTALRHEAPRVDTLNEKEVNGFHRLGTQFQEFVTQRGGQLYFATYVIPGEPGDDLTTDEIEAIRATRDGQAAINQIIRDVAAESGAGLLDLEALPLFSTRYDRRDFIDHIHFSASGNAVVARAIRQQLVERGDLPREMGD